MSQRKRTKGTKRQQERSELERLLRMCWEQGRRRERGRSEFIEGRDRALIAAYDAYRRVMDTPEERVQLQGLVPWKWTKIKEGVDPAYDILKQWTVCDMDEAYNWATFLRYAYLAGVSAGKKFFELLDADEDGLVLVTGEIDARFAREFPNEYRKWQKQLQEAQDASSG